MGAQGCSTQEDILYAYFSDPIWSQEKERQFHTYLQQIAELKFPVQPGKIKIQRIENQDWNAQWKQSIKPIEIAGKISIKPSWITVDTSSAMQIIEIDPQMAFGTGVHATTQLMLKLLIEHIGTPARIMDIGTGTGILAIAAARLSGARIIAFDIDPIAAATARENSIRNHAQDKIHFFCGTIDAVKDTHFDLILANINRSIIIESLSQIFRCLSDTGLAIFSGVLIDEKKLFIKNLQKYGFKAIEELCQDEWVGLVVRRE